MKNLVQIHIVIEYNNISLIDSEKRGDIKEIANDLKLNNL